MEEMRKEYLRQIRDGGKDGGERHISIDAAFKHFAQGNPAQGWYTLLCLFLFNPRYERDNDSDPNHKGQIGEQTITFDVSTLPWSICGASFATNGIKPSA